MNDCAQLTQAQLIERLKTLESRDDTRKQAER